MTVKELLKRLRECDPNAEVRAIDFFTDASDFVVEGIVEKNNTVYLADSE